MAEKPLIQYRNTDLDLVSDIDPAPLAIEFEARDLSAHVTPSEDGLWHVICEDVSDAEFELNIVRLLDVVESLSGSALAVWQRCSKREFDIGFDCGDRPSSFNQGLSNDVLRRMAACGATFSITLYPHHPDTEHPN